MACGQEPGRAAAGAAELGLDPKSSREPLRSLEQGRCLVSLLFRKVCVVLRGRMKSHDGGVIKTGPSVPARRDTKLWLSCW